MNKYILLIWIIVFYGCSSTKIPKKETIKIDETYQKVSFTPETISKEISTGFQISITPIDAKEMNGIAYTTTLFDGDYEKKKSISTIIEEQLKQLNLSEEERRKIELRQQISDYIKDKIKQGELPENAGDNLMWKLWNKNAGTDGTERSIGRGFPGIFNPYKVNNKYLSVFRLTFKNTSRVVKRLELRELLFNSGYEQLYPFETSYFEKLYENDQEKLRIIYRLNMPNELVMPPGETVIKYVSTPSLNPTIQNLNVKLIQDEQTESFNYSVQIDGQSQTTFLEKYTFKAKNEFNLQVKRYYLILVTENNQIHIIKENSLFLPQEIKLDNLNLYAVATLYTGYTFGKLENFKLSQYPSNQIEIKFSEPQKYRN